jgi:hypothetical protein
MYGVVPDTETSTRLRKERFEVALRARDFLYTKIPEPTGLEPDLAPKSLPFAVRGG